MFSLTQSRYVVSIIFYILALSVLGPSVTAKGNSSAQKQFDEEKLSRVTWESLSHTYISELDLVDVPLRNAILQLKELHVRDAKLDTSLHGFIPNYVLELEDAEDVHVSCTFRNVPLIRCLDYILEMSGYDFEVRGMNIHVLKRTPEVLQKELLDFIQINAPKKRFSHGVNLPLNRYLGYHQKLGSIVLPEFDVKDMKLSEVLRLLTEVSVVYDFSNERKKGITFLSKFPNSQPEPRVSCNVRNSILEKVIQSLVTQLDCHLIYDYTLVYFEPFITQYYPVSREMVWDWAYKSRKDSSGVPHGSDLLVRKYQVSKHEFSRLKRDLGTRLMVGEINVAKERESILRHFEEAGISIVSPESHFAYDGSFVVLKQPASVHRKFQDIMEPYGPVVVPEIAPNPQLVRASVYNEPVAQRNRKKFLDQSIPEFRVIDVTLGSAIKELNKKIFEEGIKNRELVALYPPELEHQFSVTMVVENHTVEEILERITNAPILSYFPYDNKVLITRFSIDYYPLSDDVMSLLGVSPADSSNKGLVSQKAVRYLKQAGIELEDPAKNIAFDGKNLIVKQVTDTQKSISNVLGRSYRDDLGDHAYDDPYIQFKKSLAKDTDSPHYLASHHFFQRVVAEKEKLKLLLGLDQSGDLSLEFREDPFGVVFKNEGSRH